MPGRAVKRAVNNWLSELLRLHRESNYAAIRDLNEVHRLCTVLSFHRPQVIGVGATPILEQRKYFSTGAISKP